MFPLVVPFFLFFFPEPKREEREDAPPRKKLLSASERLRVPTPTERLLQD
ncbi:MAG TPA: hypothetical protein VHC40_14495 [Rhizomicrobium sp.]|jgi:hypothetical protein|nr:hypothetical protein [Rhizomicrobium sp.]